MAKAASLKLGSRPPGGRVMSLGDHLAELRVRVILALLGLLAAFVFCLFFGWDLVDFFSGPLMIALKNNGLPRSFLATGIATGFTTYIKVSLIAAVFLSAPWIFYQIWHFAVSGMYITEKRLVNFFAPFSAILFILGGLFFMYVIAPLTINFFLVFNSGLDLTEASGKWFSTIIGEESAEIVVADEPGVARLHFVAPVPFTGEKLEFDLEIPVVPNLPASTNAIETRCTINDYISFILGLTLAFGISFQMPLAVMLTGLLGLVSIARLKKIRKYVFLAIMIIAAIVTPADLFSQLALAFPMYVLYELGILLLRFLPRLKGADNG